MHGEAIGVGQSPAVALAYLAVAAVIYGCARQETAKPAAAPMTLAETAD
jgi:AGZA family xanthine/uracil permease-like MFS transporter